MPKLINGVEVYIGKRRFVGEIPQCFLNNIPPKFIKTEIVEHNVEINEPEVIMPRHEDILSEISLPVPVKKSRKKNND